MQARANLCTGIGIVIGILMAFTLLGCGGNDAAVCTTTEAAPWPMAGHDLSNTRHQANETTISPSNAGKLVQKWMFQTEGDTSATPAVDGAAVYFPDWAGNLYKLDRCTGDLIWQRSIAEYTGVDDNLSRTTPAIADNKLIFGDQGGRLQQGARVMAVDKDSGDLSWVTTVDEHPAAIITQSAVVFDNRIYVGISSSEEDLAATIPGYECCTFRGSVVALDADTGDILWRTYLVPDGYSGVAVWGSTPVVDTARNSLYVSTGNNYTVPQTVSDCVAANMGDSVAVQECLAPDDYFDAVVAMDLSTGALKWGTRVIPFDAWTLGCIFDDAPNCPEPAGPDYDFGQGAALFTVTEANGQERQLVGVGQKSGKYWAFDPDTGQVVWDTQAGPGGLLGGLLWGSATDGERIYVAVANFDEKPWELIEDGQPTAQLTSSGMWSALDAATGTILWQTPDPLEFTTQAAVTVANGVVYGCSMDELGHMYAMDAQSGDILWRFASGGSCNAGAAVADGMVYWGSGYSTLSIGSTANDKFYAFGLP